MLILVYSFTAYVFHCYISVMGENGPPQVGREGFYEVAIGFYKVAVGFYEVAVGFYCRSLQNGCRYSMENQTLSKL